jgi:hypothetical protein
VFYCGQENDEKIRGDEIQTGLMMMEEGNRVQKAGSVPVNDASFAGFHSTRQARLSAANVLNIRNHEDASARVL